MAGHIEHKLLDDLRSVPHWVWFGGAAAVGLLYVMRGQGAASGTPGVPAVPVATGNASDSQDQTDLASLEAQVSELLNGNFGGPASSLPTYGPFQTPGQPAGYVAPPGPTGYAPYQQPGLGATNWGVSFVNGNLFASDLSLSGDNRTYYQWMGNAWQALTQAQVQSLVFPAGGSIASTGYRGPGNYFGINVTAPPGTTVAPPTPVTSTQ